MKCGLSLCIVFWMKCGFIVSDAGKFDKRAKADKEDRKERQKSSQVNFGGNKISKKVGVFI